MPDRIVLERVRFGFGNTRLFDGIDLAVPAGGMLVVTGRSGCGKSVLLELCAGLAEPQSGRVLWSGDDVWRMSPMRRLSLRRRVGFVFQHNALISNFTVFENIALPLRYHNGRSEWDIREHVGGFMRRLRIEELASHRPEQLSRDQARRAAFARALVMEPELLLLDEPTSGIDAVTAHTLVHMVNDMHGRGETTIVLTSQSVRAARAMHCPVGVLDNGRLSYLRHLGEPHDMRIGAETADIQGEL